jgi:hypothetical protein
MAAKCRQHPRTYLLTFMWVQRHHGFWRNLIGTLPSPLQEDFIQLQNESLKQKGGHRTALRALAWYIREADHLRALALPCFVKLLNDWVGKTRLREWDLLDLTYLPPYDLPFLQKASKVRGVHPGCGQRLCPLGNGITRYDGAPTSQVLVLRRAVSCRTLAVHERKSLGR